MTLNLHPTTCTLPRCSTAVSTISPAGPAPRPQPHRLSASAGHSSGWSRLVCHSWCHSGLYPGTQHNSNRGGRSIPAVHVPAGRFLVRPSIPLRKSLLSSLCPLSPPNSTCGLLPLAPPFWLSITHRYGLGLMAVPPHRPRSRSRRIGL